MIIDVHTHFLPPQFIVATGAERGSTTYQVKIRNRARGQVLFEATGIAAGFDLPQLFDVDRRLRDMARQGVDRQVMAVPPPFGFFYGLESDLANRCCQALNNAFAETVGPRREQFLGLATVPLQDVDAAVAELRRAVLELGLDGVEIGSHVGVRNLDDPGFTPFFAAAEDLDVPVFIHSTAALAGERLSRYHLLNLIGNPTEDAVAAASLIFGGVLQAHPRLRVYIAHGGGSTALLHGRWMRGHAVRPEARQHIDQPPDAFLGGLAFDSLTHDPKALRYVVDVIGVDHVLLGSDYPYDMADPDPVANVRALADATTEDVASILGGNAARFFRALGPRPGDAGPG